MNLLFIHETEYIEKVVYEYQIIPEIFATQGHNVYVIDFPSNWKRKSLFDLGSLHTTYIQDVHKAKKKKGITLIRPAFIKIPVLSRIVAFVHYWFLIPRIIKKYDIQCIVAFSVPTNGLQTVYWAKRLHIPIFFRLLDILHELVPSKALRSLTYALEQSVYRRVDALAATTPKLRDYAVKMGAPESRSYYIPTASDADLFFPTPKDPELVKKYGIKKSDTVVGFAGTLFNFSELDYLITYLGEHPEVDTVKLLISGHGEQEAELKSLIGKYKLENRVFLTGFIQYEELARYINTADICINLFDINKLTKDIIPGKIYQYLACGKSIIATRLPGMLNVFPENSGKPIYYCDERNPEQFFSLLHTVKNAPFKDTEPTLQDVAREFEKHITELLLKKS